LKTRERILLTSLHLFNEEGEPNVTTVDIANEIDISPGNLYYHFKGKEVIVEILYNRFDEVFSDILQAPLKKELKVEDSWYYLYVVFEEMYQYRFIYQNVTDILQRYDSVQKKFRRLLSLKYQTGYGMIRALREAGILEIDDLAIDVLVNNIVMTVTYWISYSHLRDGKQPADIILHKGVFQVLSLIAPFLAVGKQEYVKLCETFYRDALQGNLPVSFHHDDH
jgi:AcrR family transcriptional regulator